MHVIRSTALVAVLGAASLVFTGCASNLTHPPVYRGQYYAFDAYPYGYNGYPAFPYYGAPFGYGGPAFAATEQHFVGTDSKQVRTTSDSIRIRATE